MNPLLFMRFLLIGFLKAPVLSLGVPDTPTRSAPGGAGLGGLQSQLLASL